MNESEDKRSTIHVLKYGMFDIFYDSRIVTNLQMSILMFATECAYFVD